jgi:hypothetical protein
MNAYTDSINTYIGDAIEYLWQILARNENKSSLLKFIKSKNNDFVVLISSNLSCYMSTVIVYGVL